MSYQTNTLVSISNVSVVGTGTGSTLIGTTKGGSRFAPLFINLEPLSVAGTISTVPLISIGTNGASYNNISAITTLTGLNTVNTTFQIVVPSLAPSIPGGTGIYVNVTTAVTGVTPTYVFRASIIGFYY